MVNKQLRCLKRSPFIIYAGFESITVPEDNGKQNSGKSYSKEY